MLRILSRTAVLASGLALLGACSGAPETDEPEAMETAASDDAVESTDIVATLKKADGFSTFIAAVEAAGLTDTLSSGGPYTVFAPTNEAFNKMDQNVLNDLMKPENQEALAQVVNIHIFPGKTTYEELTDGMQMENLAGMTMTVHVDGNSKLIEEDLIVGSDIEASNGIVHVPNEVLTPAVDL